MEEPLWSRSSLEGESLLDRLNRSTNWSTGGCRSLSSELNSSLVACKKTGLLMRSVKWVDEGVDTGTVSTRRNTGSKVSHSTEVSSVSVELEVTVSWVMGVDEWVEVRVNWFIDVVIVNRLSNRDRGSLRSRSCNLNRSRNLDWSRGSFSDKSSRFLTSSTSWYMSTFQDSKSILASSVSHSDGLSVIINVAVLSNSFSISSGFLSVNSSILLGESRSKSSITSIESLLFQDFGIFGLSKLTTSSSNKTRGSEQLKHDFTLFYTSSFAQAQTMLHNQLPM